MSNDTESAWVKWTRNGRLSFIVWSLTAGAWVGFKLARIPVEGLDTVFIVMSGLLAGNLGISTIKPPDKSKTDSDG